MAASMQYTCDHCGTPKGTANHWFLLIVAGRCMQIRPWFGLMSPDAAGARHICGERCLQSEISAAIAHGKGERFLLREAPEQVVTLRERLDDLDGRDIDREVGAR